MYSYFLFFLPSFCAKHNTVGVIKIRLSLVEHGNNNALKGSLKTKS